MSASHSQVVLTDAPGAFVCVRVYIAAATCPDVDSAIAVNRATPWQRFTSIVSGSRLQVKGWAHSSGECSFSMARETGPLGRFFSFFRIV